MTARTFIYSQLTTFAPLIALIGGSPNPRVFAKKTMTSSIEDCPYIVYKLGNSTNEEFSEADGAPEIDRQYLQVWVHDFHDGETGDYMAIDSVLTQVRAALTGQSSAADGIWTIRYLETSQDLNDDTLNTLFRYARFQIIKKEM